MRIADAKLPHELCALLLGDWTYAYALDARKNRREQKVRTVRREYKMDMRSWLFEELQKCVLRLMISARDTHRFRI